MIDEYSNKKASEFTPQNESKFSKEIVAISENKPVTENVPVKENVEFDGKQKDKKSVAKSRDRAMSVMTSSLVGVIGIAVVGMTNLLNVKFKAEYESFELRLAENRVVYSIKVKDMTEKEYLMIYPERDGLKLESQRFELSDVNSEGYIKGEYTLDADYIASHKNKKIDYKFRLRGLVGLDVERLFDNYDVTIKNFSYSFNGVSGHCTCSVDGYYHFTMDYKDEGGLLTDFEAYIVDSFYDSVEEEDKVNHIAYCTFNDDLHSEQKIFIGNLEGSKGRLFVKYKSADGEQHVVKDQNDGLDGIQITM